MFPRFSSGQGGNVVRPGKWSGSMAGAQSMYILTVVSYLMSVGVFQGWRFTWANIGIVLLVLIPIVTHYYHLPK